MKKNMVYFVLYIVILVELLIVITERDELEAKEHEIRDKMISTLAKSYKQPVILSVPQRESEFTIGSKEPHKVVMTPAGLVSEEEKDHLNYFIDINPKSKKKPSGWPDGGINLHNMTERYKIIKNNGNAIFVSNLPVVGQYKFQVYCELERQLPGYLTEELLEQLREEVGEHQLVASEKVGFQINVKRKGGVRTMEAEISF